MTEPAILQSDDVSLSNLRSAWLYTLVRLQNEPHAAAFVQPMVDFGPKWDTTSAQERSLRDAMIFAEAATVAADRQLDGLYDRVSNAIHHGKKPDTSLPLHVLFFGALAPSVAKKPTLGEQLDRAETWPEQLFKSTSPDLQALASDANAIVTQGQKAQDALREARKQNEEFRLVGGRKQLFDLFNALMASTYGGLKTLIHDHPKLGLDLVWVDSFFRREPRDRGPRTVDQADRLIAKLDDKVAEAQASRNALVAEAQAHAEAVQAKAEADAALAAAREAADAAEKAQKAAEEAAQKAAQKARKKGKK